MRVPASKVAPIGENAVNDDVAGSAQRNAQSTYGAGCTTLVLHSSTTLVPHPSTTLVAGFNGSAQRNAESTYVHPITQEG